jgi:hypothetical protein
MSKVIRIENIQNYTLVISDNTLTLTPKELGILTEEPEILTEDKLRMLDFRNVTILSSVIKSDSAIISEKTTLVCVLFDTLNSMTREQVIETTNLNYILNHNTEDGTGDYYWSRILNISFYCAINDNDIMKEILHMVKINNYTINLSIKLKNGKIVNF